MRPLTLFFDTETTGKLDWKREPAAPGQPRLVQLGAILAAGPDEILATLDVIIRPRGFEIPEEASRIHGIDTLTAEARGVELLPVLRMFDRLVRAAETLVAFNVDFDRGILTGEYGRAGELLPWATAGKKWFDPMKASTMLCQIPGPYGFKWPKLEEAHRILVGSEMVGAHGALADCRATAAVYWELKRRGVA